MLNLLGGIGVGLGVAVGMAVAVGVGPGGTFAATKPKSTAKLPFLSSPSILKSGSVLARKSITGLRTGVPEPPA